MIFNRKKFLKYFFFASLGFYFLASIFCESEEELKKRILSEANLAGQSEAELMAGDDEDEKSSWWPFSKSPEKRLPETFEREVPFTKIMNEFREAYFNHQLLTPEIRKEFRQKAILAAEQSTDEYSRLVRLARAEYYYGCSLIETFDLSTLENLDEVEKKSAEEVEGESAGDIFDKAIEYGEAALEIKAGTDAYTIISHAISANCTAKSWSYILGNALKVRSYAKKAVKLDYSNGTAHFLNIAQDIYAPWPICKLRSGRKKMLEILNNKYLRLDDQDKLLICSAVGFSFFKQKKWDKAIEWYNKSLDIYPQNFSARQMISRIKERRKK